MSSTSFQTTSRAISDHRLQTHALVTFVSLSKKLKTISRSSGMNRMWCDLMTGRVQVG